MIPQYKKVHIALNRQILSGAFQEGSLLPSENELCQTYNISRMTVRHALSELVKDGLIQKKTGKGSVVVNTRKSLAVLSFKGFTEVVGSSEKKPTTVNIKGPFETDWQESFFYKLSEKEKAAGVIKIERLRLADEKPVMLEHTFIPNIDLPHFCTSPLLKYSLFNTLLVNHNIKILSIEQDVRAISTPPKIGGLLDLEEYAPLLHIYRKYYTSRNNFFIYSSLYCNTNNYTIGNKFNYE
ncbi:MAG: DNA-binding GntR family transcriptional regulator [Arcticibacterium sp.]|jgi:DNA-binding GntR family transcriptional regulator